MLSDQEIIKLQIAVADQQVMIYAYWRLLSDLVDRHDTLTNEELERVRDILDKELAQVKKILVCECGHVQADHDKRGCTYIGCRYVCVRTNATNQGSLTD